jgi:hypothetical protein
LLHVIRIKMRALARVQHILRYRALKKNPQCRVEELLEDPWNAAMQSSTGYALDT